MNYLDFLKINIIALQCRNNENIDRCIFDKLNDKESHINNNSLWIIISKEKNLIRFLKF